MKMVSRPDFSSLKMSRMSTLESSWNSSMQLSNQPRRHEQMSKDIKKFLVNSMERETQQAERLAVQRARKKDGIDIIGKISSTFNFIHHEGTDAKTELKVVKIILIREGHLLTLAHLSDKARVAENANYFCSAILEVLAEIRESTLNYLEALCLWRNSIPEGHTMSPRIFFWEDKNYTLKIVNDLDFLANNPLIVKSLNISPEQFRSNPLMLTNNLDDPSTWINPSDRAGRDTGGILQGPIYETRLRLRYAERILLQEIELSTNSSAEDGGAFLTQAPQPPVPTSAMQAMTKQPVRGSAALEYDTGDDSFYRGGRCLVFVVILVFFLSPVIYFVQREIRVAWRVSRCGACPTPSTAIHVSRAEIRSLPCATRGPTHKASSQCWRLPLLPDQSRALQPQQATLRVPWRGGSALGADRVVRGVCCLMWSPQAERAAR